MPEARRDVRPFLCSAALFRRLLRRMRRAPRLRAGMGFARSNCREEFLEARIVAHGIGTGATIAVRSAAFSDVFGGANFGTIFGLLAVAYPIGGTLAVYVGAVALDRTGSSLALIPLVLVALGVWIVSLWIAGPRKRRGAGLPAAA